VQKLVTIKELQRLTKILYLTIERTKEDSDWVHDSINRADLSQISSKNGSILLYCINHCFILLCFIILLLYLVGLLTIKDFFDD